MNSCKADRGEKRMENLMDTMQLCRTAGWICFGVAAAALAAAVILFFLLDIRTIILIRTGRAKRRAVREIQDRKQWRGDLRADPDPIKTLPLPERPGTGLAWQSGAETGKDTAPAFMQESTSTGGGMTEELWPGLEGEKGRPDPGPSFRVVRKMLVTHTEERIVSRL